MSTIEGQAGTLCNICKSKGTLRCKGCNNVRYCSIECQKTDWPIHKLLCGSFKGYESDRPSKPFRRAIFFPPDKKKPEFIWVEVRKYRDRYDNVDFEVPHLSSYVAAFNTDHSKMLPDYGETLLGNGNLSAPDRRLIQHNVLRDRDLDHTLEILYRDTVLVDGSRPNKSVIEVTKGKPPHEWKGPIVALRKEGGAINPRRLINEQRFYNDITLEDFRHVVDYFQNYGDEKVNNELWEDTLKEMDKSGKKGSFSKEDLGNDSQSARKETSLKKDSGNKSESGKKEASLKKDSGNKSESGKKENRLNEAWEKAGISARTEDGLDKILEELSITSRKVAPWNKTEGNDDKSAKKVALKKTLEEKIKSGGKTKGVRISCEGDQRIFRAKKYISVDVAADHPIFSSTDPPPDISQLIDLPILVSKYPPDPAWKDRPVASMYDNQSATFLNLNADPSNDHWFGWAGPQWQSRVGIVLVVRQDGKDLTTQHVDALCEYCQFRMQPLFEAWGEGARRKEDVMSFLTREKFARFWRDYKVEMMRVDSGWKDVESPYDVS